MQRRGADSFVLQRQAAERLERAAKAGELERAQRQTEGLILDLSSSLSTAKAELKKQTEQRPAVADLDAGKAAAAAWFEQQKQLETGKQQATSAFEQWKNEQAAKVQAEADLRQRQADLLVEQRQAAEAKKQAEIERQKLAEKPAAKEQEPQPKRGKDTGYRFER
jgi:hypothetical protein